MRLADIAPRLALARDQYVAEQRALEQSYGGPVWHASARGTMAGTSWSMAERALRSVGDAGLGEWRETGRDGVVHIRRRLTEVERMIGRREPLQVRDIRCSAEAARRRRALLADAPYLRDLVRALAAEEATA